eukprot:COSAG06_NODE_740_length_12667_cov_5.783180_4_plen_263_part_00
MPASEDSDSWSDDSDGTSGFSWALAEVGESFSDEDLGGDNEGSDDEPTSPQGFKVVMDWTPRTVATSARLAAEARAVPRSSSRRVRSPELPRPPRPQSPGLNVLAGAVSAAERASAAVVARAAAAAYSSARSSGVDAATTVSAVYATGDRYGRPHADGLAILAWERSDAQEGAAAENEARARAAAAARIRAEAEARAIARVEAQEAAAAAHEQWCTPVARCSIFGRDAGIPPPFRHGVRLNRPPQRPPGPFGAPQRRARGRP